MKKLYICFGVILISVLWEITTYAESVEKGSLNDNISWEVTRERVLIVSGVGEIVNPDNKYPWNDLSNPYTAIVVNEGITAIGKYAFTQMEYVKKVSLPEGLKKIGVNAFYADPYRLSKAIDNSEKLNTDTKFARDTFELPSTIEEIEIGALKGLMLEKLYIPENVRQIDLTNEKILKTIEVSEKNQYYASIDGVLFNKEKSVLLKYPPQKSFGESYAIPEGVKIIETRAFEYAKLASVVIPEGVTEIGELAFTQCMNLKEITIPKSLLIIGYAAFSGDDSVYAHIPLDTIYYNGSYEDWEKIEKGLGHTSISGFTQKVVITDVIKKSQKYYNEISVRLNNAYVLLNGKPYIKNDRTLVPMRAIFEALGATVTWDDTTKTAIGVKDGVEIKITIGENVLYKNGEEVELDAVAEITNDRTMVPVRAISEAFGCTVTWNDETKTVEITY